MAISSSCRSAPLLLVMAIRPAMTHSVLDGALSRFRYRLYVGNHRGSEGGQGYVRKLPSNQSVTGVFERWYKTCYISAVAVISATAVISDVTWFWQSSHIGLNVSGRRRPASALAAAIEELSMGTRFDYTVLSLGAGLFMVAVWLGLFGTVQAADAKAAKAYTVELPHPSRSSGGYRRALSRRARGPGRRSRRSRAARTPRRSAGEDSLRRPRSDPRH